MLLVAIDFPPARTSGIYRPVYLCKHLSERGYDITVLTVAQHESLQRDEDILEKVAGKVKIIYRNGPNIK